MKDIAQLYQENLETIMKQGIPPPNLSPNFLSYVSETLAEKEAPNSKNKLSTEEKQIMKAMVKEYESLASKQSVQMFYDSYMSPTNSDIVYRLGEVKKVKIKEPNTTNAPQITPDGRLHYKSAFSLEFPKRSLSTNGIVEDVETFTSLFFPPYYYNGEADDKTSYVNIFPSYSSKEVNENVKEGTENEAKKTIYLEEGVIDRPLYTYRGVSFKALNDNINMLQYLLQKVTGIVSTYMTEWDISLYIQEGLINQKESEKNMIYLNHRIMKDNPLGYTDEKALVFGNLNASISKFAGYTSHYYKPQFYPYSKDYVFYTNTKTKTTPTDITVDGEPESQKISYVYPKFYDVAKTASYTNLSPLSSIDGLGGGTDFKKKIELTDIRNASDSGWANWALPYWKLFYNCDGDGLCPTDIKHMNAESDRIKHIESMRSLVETQLIGNQTNEVLSENSIYPSSSEHNANNPLNFKEGKEIKAGESVSTDTISTIADKAESGYSDVASMLGCDDSKPNEKPSVTVGMAVNNPFFSGGPHSAVCGTGSPQSFFDKSSPSLRKIPRINSDINGVRGYYYTKGFPVSRNISDYCPLKSFNLFKEGLLCKHTVKLPPNYTINSTYFSKFSPFNLPSKGSYGAISYYGPFNFSENYATVDFHEFIKGDYTSIKVVDGNKIYSKYKVFSRKGTETTPIGLKTSTTAYSIPNLPKMSWNIGLFNVVEGSVKKTNKMDFEAWYGSIQSHSYHATYVINTKYKFNVDGSRIKGCDFNTGEKQFIRNFFLSEADSYAILNRENTDAEVILCESSDSSYDQRMTNGPSSLIKLKVKIGKVTTLVKTRKVVKTLKAGCKTKKAYGDVLTPKETFIMEIDPNSISAVYTNLDKDSWSNAFLDPEKSSTEDCISESFLRAKGNFSSLFDANPKNTFIPSGTGTTGSVSSIYGWGVLSNIQGYNPSIPYNANSGYSDMLGPFFQSYHVDPKVAVSILGNLKKLNPSLSESSLNEKYNILNLPRPTYEVGAISSLGPLFIKTSSDGFDLGLKKAIARLLTSGTFYKSDSDYKCYKITSDSPIRTLANQLLVQSSYMTSMLEIIFGGSLIDMKMINVIMKDYIAKDVLEASDKSSKKYSQTSRSYNYWVEIACKYFMGNESDSEKARKSMEEKIAEIEILSGAFEKIFSSAKNSNIVLWTPSTMYSAFDALSKAERLLTQSSEYEEFIFAYLTVLYEVRKYFIFQRCNKMDGTLWVVRQLEGVMPLIMEKMVEKEPTKDENGTDDGNTVNVSFYDIQNSLTDKTKAYQTDGSTLPEDRITKVYIKVKYVTKEKYDEETVNINKDLSSSSQRKFVKISKPTFDPLDDTKITGFTDAYAVGYEDGKYYLSSDQEDKLHTDMLYNKAIDKEIEFIKNNLETVNTLEAKKRVINNTDVDLCVFDIAWGNEKSKTPIVFNIYKGVDATKMTSSTDPFEAVCNNKLEGDYWTVAIPIEERPRAKGYIKNVSLKLFADDTSLDSDGNNKGTYDSTLCGAMSNVIFPITEEQANPSPLAIDKTVVKNLNEDIFKK